MRLKAGGRYLTRDGKEVTVCDNPDSTTYPFAEVGGRREWMAHGWFWFPGWETRVDLVSEVVDPAPLAIVAGQYYRARDGRRYYVVSTDCPHPDYPVVGWSDNGTPCSWRADGTFYLGNASIDLIGPWEEPKPKVLRAQYIWINKYGIPEQTLEYYRSAEELRLDYDAPDLQVLRVDYTEREFDK